MLKINVVDFDPNSKILEHHWNRLVQKLNAQSISMSYVWYRSCAFACRKFSKQALLLEIKEMETGKIVGIIPFEARKEKIYRFFNVNSIHFMKLQGEFGDHYEMLLDPDFFEESMNIIVKWVLENGIDVCFLNNLIPESKTFHNLQKYNKKHLIFGERKKVATPYIKLPGIDDFDHWVSGKYKRVRKYKKKFEKDFSVSYKRVETQDELDRLLKVYRVLHSSRFERMGERSSITSDPGQDYFLSTLVKESLEKGLLRAFYIEIDDRIVSMDISFKINSSVYSFTTSFDEKYSRYRLGSIQLLSSLQSCVSEGVEIFDLLQGSEGYKFNWTNDSSFDESRVIFPRTVHGHFLYLLSKIKRVIQTKKTLQLEEQANGVPVLPPLKCHKT